MLSPWLCLHGNMEDMMADSIDVLMCLMFDFINEVCYNDGISLSFSFSSSFTLFL